MKTSIGLIVLLSILTLESIHATVRQVPSQYPSIQAGINAALTGDTVLVADGRYYENINFRGKAITVASHLLIDGDTLHLDNTIIDGSQPTFPDSGSVVSFVSGEDTTSVLYGFSITGGSGTLYDPTNRLGGGVYLCSSSARITHNKIQQNSVTHSQRAFGGGIGSFPKYGSHSLILEESLIESNSLVGGDRAAGGGVYLHQGRIVRNSINQNWADGQSYGGAGGGIAFVCDTTYGRTLAVIIGNRITNNQASSTNGFGAGGGVYVQSCDAQLEGNWISQNQLTGKTEGYGGGVAIWWSRSTTSAKDNMFISNSAGNAGLTNGGGLCLLQSPGITIQGNRFEGNEAPTYDGGGIYCYDSSPTFMTGNVFKNNHARYGAGICSEGDIILTNNLLIENEAEIGGAVCVYRVPPVEGVCRIINNTLCSNVADLSAGGMYTANMSTLIMNTICYGNAAPVGPEIEVQMGSLNAAYSNIRFGIDSIWVHDNGVVDWLAGNVTGNPGFLDTSFRLADTSSCIGAGIDSLLVGALWYRAPTNCFYGSPRPNPVGSRPDVGACESPLATPISVGVADARGDSPKGYWLGQNYPNPFNPRTSITYALPIFTSVTLMVFDMLGREVATLQEGGRPPGYYSIEFDGKNLGSGLYLYRLIAGDWVETKKMLVVK